MRLFQAFIILTVLICVSNVYASEEGEMPEVYSPSRPLDYRDPDMFVDPSEIFDTENRDGKDPLKRYRAFTQVFSPAHRVDGRVPREDYEY